MFVLRFNKNLILLFLYITNVYKLILPLPWSTGNNTKYFFLFVLLLFRAI
uniref:Uncharacterized protein n=1 Tax=Solanum lycopersicum TaxID=4081 RepID=A0A3Q7HAY6_SOLLC